MAEARQVRAAGEGMSEGEIERTLDYVLAHKMEFTQDFLRARDLPFSGTKEELRARLAGYVSDRRVPPEALVLLLNTIEGWGNQHIYFYRAPARLVAPWRTEASARERVAELGLEGLLGRPRPLIFPEEPTLASIEWSPERVRFIWVEKREWLERLSEKDFEEGNVVYRAHRRREARGLVTFDWDLDSGEGMLMIQRQRARRTYRTIRDDYARELGGLVGLHHFDTVRVSRAIRFIEASDEVRRRQLTYMTQKGGQAGMKSAGRRVDTRSDPALVEVGQALEDNKAGLMGNFYWLLTEGEVTTELHSKIYGSDQRVGIFGEHHERHVRYVVSRIRHYCA